MYVSLYEVCSVTLSDINDSSSDTDDDITAAPV